MFFVTDPNVQGEVPGVSIAIYDNLSKKLAKDWWEDNIKQYGDYQDLLTKTVREERIISGNKGYYVTVGSDWYSRPFTSFFIIKDKKVYSISTDFIARDVQWYALYEKMLSTFKFIN